MKVEGLWLRVEGLFKVNGGGILEDGKFPPLGFAAWLVQEPSARPNGTLA